MDRVRVGVAGWSLTTRHARMFPKDGSHLERYAAVFDCVEINSSFYRPHAPKTYRRWAESVPRDFRFSAKLPKAISHDARLKHCDSLLERFLAQVEQLGERLGFLLLQLPPSLAFDDRSALRFLDHLCRRHGGAVGIEPRHASWFTAGVDRALRERGVTRVAADPFRIPRAAIPGGAHGTEYVRLHGSPVMYRDAYTPEALTRIARRLVRAASRTRERWCILDNTTFGHAISDALALQALVGRKTERTREMKSRRSARPPAR